MRRRHRLAGLITLFLVLLSACSSDAPPTDRVTFGPAETTDTSASTGPESSIGEVAVATTECGSGVGGEAQIDPRPEPPPEEEVPGAAGPTTPPMNEHERPVPPDVPGAVVPDLSGIADVLDSGSGAQGAAQPDEVTFYQPVSTLSAGRSTSTTAEPEVATDGRNALLTWNWLAAVSRDGGRSFEYVNPATNFPSVNGGFCCDQRAFFVERQGIWLWELQYSSDDAGNNTVRLAWADADGFAANRWRFVDWTAQDLGFPDGVMLDQTKMAMSDDAVFLSINAFVDATGRFTGAVVIRVPLSSLTSGGAVAASCFRPTQSDTGRDLFGLIPARGATDTMYLLGHVNVATLAVYRWRDGQAGPDVRYVTDYTDDGEVIKYPQAERYSCLRAQAAPETDWCLRPSTDGRPGNDARPTTAWLANGRLGVAWNASQEGTTTPFPFVWVVVLDPSRLDSCTTGDCVVGYPHILSRTFAIQYAAIAENQDGVLGAVALMGGGDRTLRCTVLTRLDAMRAGGWQFIEAGASNADLPRPKSGDYLGITPDAPGSRSWLGTCMSYQASGADGEMQVHVARFGLQRDAPAQ